MYKQLYEKINYSFKDENILDLVFTHKSSGKKIMRDWSSLEMRFLEL